MIRLSLLTITKDSVYFLYIGFTFDCSSAKPNKAVENITRGSLEDHRANSQAGGMRCAWGGISLVFNHCIAVVGSSSSSRSAVV